MTWLDPIAISWPMRDLFDAPVLPGFACLPDIVTPDEEARLIAAIDAAGPTPFRFQQWTGKRLTTSFGWSYDFQSGALDEAAPIPAWLIPLRDRAAAFAGLAPDRLTQVLLTRYDPGAGIGWHKDRPIYEDVIGISLGAAAVMRFRRRDGARWRRASVPLEPRGAYRLGGEVRHHWEHGIAPMSDETRHSITFRSFSAKGRALVALSV